MPSFVKRALPHTDTSTRNSKHLSAHANNCSTATLSSADLHLHTCGTLPSPPLTLASPHPGSQLKRCQSMLAKISFSPSASLLLPCFRLHQLPSERQLRQTGIPDKLCEGGVSTELLNVLVFSTGNCSAITLLSLLSTCVRRGGRPCVLVYGCVCCVLRLRTLISPEK